MVENWAPIKFKDIVNDFKRGPFGSTIKKSFFVPKGYKVYEQQHAIYDDHTRGRYYISEGKFNEMIDFAVFPGDYIVSCSGTIGKISKLPPMAAKGIINQALLRIRLNERLVEGRWFLYLFRSLLFQKRILKETRGSAMKNIAGVKELKEVYLDLPSIPEQKQVISFIEEYFSDLDNAIENLKKVQKQLKVYRQAVLKSAFDGGLLPQESKWKFLPLSEACQFNPSKSESKDISDDTEVSFLPMPCVSENGKILKHDVRQYRDVKKGYTYFRDNDVLLAKITPCFENGKKAIAYDLINGIGFGSTEFHVLRPKGEVVSKWILLAISQEAFRNQAIMQMTGAVGQKRVPQRVVEEYKIPVPLKEEQNKIIQEVESRFSVCDKLEETIESSMGQAESLRQSILKQAFEGKLTARWRKEHKDLIFGENSAEALLKKIKAEKEALQVKLKGKKKHD